MKGTPEVLDELNKNLEGELTAINQYIAHAGHFQNAGYTKLAQKIREIARQEREHSEELIQRIMFLSGSLTRYSATAYPPMGDVKEMLESDLSLERTGSADYNAAARIAAHAEDNGSRDLFAHILSEEETHLNFFESQVSQIGQMGLDNYLASQL